MITPDAKCVNNGKKVNEAINAINPLLGMSVGYTAGGTPPQVTYSDTEVKILLPLADSVEGFSLEELDIVDTNNAASSRYFMTSLSSVSTYGTTTASTSGTPTGKQSSPQPTTGRNKLDAGGNNADNNRDKLNTGGALLDNRGGGVAPVNKITSGGGLRDDGQTAEQSRKNFIEGKKRAEAKQPQVDEFGNTIGGTGGALRDDGTTTAGGGINSLNTGGALRDDSFFTTRTNKAAADKAAADKAAAGKSAADIVAAAKAAADKAAADKAAADKAAADKAEKETKDKFIRRMNAERAARIAEEEARELEKRAIDTKLRIEAGNALREKNQARTDANKYGETQDWEAANVQSIMEAQLVKVHQLSKWIYANRRLDANDPTYKAKREELQKAQFLYGKAKKIHLRNVNNRS